MQQVPAVQSEGQTQLVGSTPAERRPPAARRHRVQTAPAWSGPSLQQGDAAVTGSSCSRPLQEAGLALPLPAAAAPPSCSRSASRCAIESCRQSRQQATGSAQGKEGGRMFAPPPSSGLGGSIGQGMRYQARTNQPAAQQHWSQPLAGSVRAWPPQPQLQTIASTCKQRLAAGGCKTSRPCRACNLHATRHPSCSPPAAAT